MASVGPTLKVEGFNQYKKTMNELIQQGKTLDSEMKKVASTWDENTDAQQKAADKAKVLTEKVENQRKQIDALKDMVEKATAQYGESSKEAQTYKEKLNLAEAALNDMNRELDKSQAELKQSAEKTEDGNDALDEQQEELKESTAEQKRHGKASDEAGDKSKKFGEVAKAAAHTAAASFKAAATAAAATATAIAAASVKLGKEVVSAYADYEQLSGGVETLFGEDAKTVEKNAANAFKTAGMTANQYMETVTGFSASLISSLGGDTEKAAQYAHMAITDMSDNANKMGSDIQSIQNAYQGFAKGQYNMLDNLKLGYGGTKTEMERLIKDAEKADKSFKASRDTNGKLKMSYDEVVKAIHIVQTSMDITGTTAKEAEHTIAGSIDSAKAAVQNLITGLGSADADIEGLSRNVIESFESVITNISPIVRNLAQSLPQVVSTAADSILENKDELLTVAKSVFEAVMTSLQEILPETANFLASALPEIVSTVTEALDMLTGMISNFLHNPEQLQKIITAGVDLLISLVTNISEIATAVVDALPFIIDSIVEALTAEDGENIRKIIQAGVKLLTALITNLPKIIKTIVDALPQIIEDIFTELTKTENLAKMAEAGAALITALFGAVKEMFMKIAGWLGEAVDDLVYSIKSELGLTTTEEDARRYWFGGSKSSHTKNGQTYGGHGGKFGSGADDLDQRGQSKTSAKSAPGGIYKPGTGSAATHAKGGILKRGQIALLEGEGAEAVVPLEKHTEWIAAVGRELAGYLAGTAPVSLDSGRGSGGTTNNYTRNLGGVTIEIHAAPGQSEEAIADAVMDRINDLMTGERDAW